MNRRAFLGIAAAAAAPAAVASKATPLCAFSKHFQWLSVPEAARLCAEIGFDAVDLTVRSGGHVLPERVDGDLPRAVEAVRAAGLEAPMITAGIVDVNSPHCEAMIRTASKLGISRYRWGGFRYDTAKPIAAQIAEFRARAIELAAMNRQYSACAMYHTHSGVGQFGSSFWDIHAVLKDLDHNLVSVNFDIGHATVEGGLGGWINSTRLLLPMTRGIALKDFRWEKNDRGRWAVRWCMVGQGMVNFRDYLAMVKQADFRGPLQFHNEYRELGGAESGRATISISREEFTRTLKEDVAALRALLNESGLA
jgi:sugar phosphate isomerase/epimerase